MTPDQISCLIDDRASQGIFKVHPDIFRSAEILELEQKHIFGATWLYVAHESQIAKPHDFVLSHMAGQPVVVSRDQSGQIHCFLNSCRHRGALVCQQSFGNAKVHVCPYHAWSYDSAGRNVSVPAKSQGGYSPAFDDDDQHLRPVPKLQSYRGFIFASLNINVPPLDEHLGHMRTFIDLAADQGSDGLEVLPGIVSYELKANWKMLIENSADDYHFVPTHQSYLEILHKRQEEKGAGGVFNLEDPPRTWSFEHGHNAYTAPGQAGDRPLDLDREILTERVGTTRAKWMGYVRNCLFFPNMILLEAPVLQIRMYRPLAVDRTLVTTHCVAPKGESAEARLRRLRLYEEFYNPGGMATPDDLMNLEACQLGQQRPVKDWLQGYMRGLDVIETGPTEDAGELGIAPISASGRLTGLGDETILHEPLREWRRLLTAGLSAAQSTA